MTQGYRYHKLRKTFGKFYSILILCRLAISVSTYRPCCHGGTLPVSLTKDYGHFLKKGPKYRLPSRIDFTKCRSIVEEALQTYFKRWCKKEGVGVHALNDWKNEFLRIVDIRIENCTTHPHLYKQPPSFSVKALKRKMEKSHSKYVFAPADKAANNVIIIWKRYYVEVLKEELNSTSTYVPAQLTKDKLLLRHIDTLTKSNIKIDKLDLPTFYCLPKLNKNTYQSRFISNSSHCSTTILSKHITSALTAVKDHAIKNSETALSNSIVNYFWIIKNSSEVIEKLRLRNFQGSQVSSFDFSTLYTSLLHDLIKTKVLSLYNSVLRESQKLTSVRQIRRDFSPSKIWLVCMFDLHWVIWSFYFHHGKYICAIWGHGVPTNSGDSY